MSAYIHIFKVALDDIENALDWYESQSAGLEQRFNREINNSLTFIAENPEASPIRAENFRGRLLKKFPYIIFYDYDSISNTVFIAAFLHQKQDKTILKKR